MTQPPDWATDTPSHPPVHTEPPRNYQWDQMSQDELQAMRKRLIDSILQIIVQAVTGLFFPGGGIFGAFNQLEDWADGLFGPDSPIDANNLFNFIPQALFGLIPFSHVGDTNPNLFLHPGFEAAVSVQGTDFLWSSGVGRTAAGSGYIVANGVEHEFLSNPVAVAAGQKLDLWIYSRWAGLVYSDAGEVLPLPVTLPATLSDTPSGGGPSLLPLRLPFTLGDTSSSSGLPVIKVQVLRMLNNAVVGTTDLQVVRSPAADQATWLQLGDDVYTVPSGCDVIRLRFVVTADATAGTVWIDDGDIRKTGLMQMPWIEGLTGSLGFWVRAFRGSSTLSFRRSQDSPTFSQSGAAGSVRGVAEHSVLEHPGDRRAREYRRDRCNPRGIN